MQKIIRITTVPQSLKILLKGQLNFINKYFQVIGISSYGPDLDVVKEIEGIRTIPVEMTRKITLIKDVKAVWKLYKIFKAERPLIVHTHTPKAGTVGMIAAKMAKIPHRLHTVAGLPLLEARGKRRVLLDIVEKLTYACATRLYPNSAALMNIIIQNKYAKEEKLKVMAEGSSNGIDTTFFNSSLISLSDREILRQSIGIQKEDFVFIFVGRVVKNKGVTELIESFQMLNRIYLHIKLLIVGKYEDELDPLTQETKSQIKSNTFIRYVGYQEDVRPYFSISHCLVFPSYREGFPNVVLQAGAMGLPSIVSDINGCNEIIIEGVNGIIVPPKDVVALEIAMRKMVDNKSYYRQLQGNARVMIKEKYEQKKVWRALLEEYNVLVNSKILSD